jgi:group I intron endonuclease
MGNSGIYKITNTVNGNFYIGSSSNIRKRKEKHFRYLRKGGHENKHLQNAFNKYGEEAFIFEVIKLVEQSQLLQEEQILLNEHFGKPYFYNMCPTAGSPAVKGRIKTELHRTKIAESVKQFYKNNPLHKEKLAEYKRGISLPEETRQKMRESKKRGNEHHNAKLNEMIVKEIRQKYQPKTYSYGKLAEEFGVDRKTIIRIIQRKTWTHI